MRKTDDRRQLQAFLGEARLLRKIRHPQVLNVLDAGTISDRPFIVSELAPDGTLESLLSRAGRIRIGRVIHLFLDVLRGLRLCRGDGILHRDVKPANIFLFGDRAKIGDLGIAHRYEDFGGAPSADEIVGTPSYMAPEVLRGEPASFASDVFSASLVLYEMLTGREALDQATLARIMRGEPFEIHLPDGLVDAIGSVLATIIARALSPIREQRYLIAYHLSQAILEAAKVSSWGAPAGWRPLGGQLDKRPTHPTIVTYPLDPLDPW